MVFDHPTAIFLTDHVAVPELLEIGATAVATQQATDLTTKISRVVGTTFQRLRAHNDCSDTQTPSDNITEALHKIDDLTRAWKSPVNPAANRSR